LQLAIFAIENGGQHIFQSACLPLLLYRDKIARRRLDIMWGSTIGSPPLLISFNPIFYLLTVTPLAVINCVRV
jgi:hypothetical protein